MSGNRESDQNVPDDSVHSRIKSTTLVVSAAVSIAAIFVSIITVVGEISKNRNSLRFLCLAQEIEFSSKLMDRQISMLDRGLNYTDIIFENLTETNDKREKSYIYTVSAWPLLRDEANKQSWANLRRAAVESDGEMRDSLEKTVSRAVAHLVESLGVPNAAEI